MLPLIMNGSPQGPTEATAGALPDGLFEAVTFGDRAAIDRLMATPGATVSPDAVGVLFELWTESGAVDADVLAWLVEQGAPVGATDEASPLFQALAQGSVKGIEQFAPSPLPTNCLALERV